MIHGLPFVLQVQNQNQIYIKAVGESEADAKKIANIEAEINAFVGEYWFLRLRAVSKSFYTWSLGLGKQVTFFHIRSHVHL